MPIAIKINPKDNVVVALHPIAKGTAVPVDNTTVTAIEDIPQGHKFALRDIRSGEEVVKYGFRIGYAKEDIKAGSWVHVHNVKTALGDVLTYDYIPDGRDVEPTDHVFFDGYRRADGRVGIRNELWIVPTVGCVNGVARSMARRVEDYARGRVDGVHVWFHPYGCSQMGEDQEHTRAILCGLIRHPNAGAVLVLGLGCENSSIAVLQERLGRWDSQRVAFLEKTLKNKGMDSVRLYSLERLEPDEYHIFKANVIKNSLNRVDNYITLDEGTSAGIRPEMGVVDANGVVGIVYKTSPHYSTVIPLLNSKSSISCKIVGSEYFGYLKWEYGDSRYAYLKDLPRHAEFNLGDTVVTSGYSTVFPAGIMVGTVDDMSDSHDGLSYLLKIKLATDFGKVSNVRVIARTGQEEQKALEKEEEK